MTHEAHRCEGCGASLPAPDAVCGHCEAELAREPPGAPARYICPQCHGRFAALAPVAWPPKVPWWRPTTLRLQCPRCDTPLRDRHARPLPGWGVFAVIAVAVGSQLFTTGWTRMLLGLSLVGLLYAPLVLAAWRGRRDATHPHRYVVGSTRVWAQGNDDLARAVDRMRHPGKQDPPR